MQRKNSDGGRRRRLATVARGALVVGLGTSLLSGCLVESGRTEQSRSIGDAVPCPVDPDPTVTATVRIGWQEIPSGDLVAKDSGLLETCMPKAKVVWSKFSSGGDVIQAFGANSLDIGLLGSAPASRALSAPLNIPMRVVWIQDQIGAAESLVVKDRAVRTVADLRGRTVGVPFASTAHYSLMTALDRAGVTADVRVINLTPDAIRGAWSGGQIDAAYIWEPGLTQLVASGGHIVTDSAQVGREGAPTFDLEGARTDFVRENPRFMTIWTAVQSWAVRQLRDHPDQAAVRIAGQLGVPAEQVLTQIRGYQYFDAAEQTDAARLGGGLGADLRNTAWFLLQQGGIDALNPSATYTDAIYPDAAREVSSR